MGSFQLVWTLAIRIMKKAGLNAFMTVVVGCAGLFAGSVAEAAPKLCIPTAQGVPYLSGYPDWWTQSVDPNINRLAFSFNQDDSKRTDDPRWVGALDIGHSMGATDNAEVRALYATINQKRHLLLSWSAKSMDQFLNGFTSVVFGLKSPSGSAVVVKAQIDQSTTMVGSEVKPRPATDGGVTYLSFTAFSKSGTANWTNAAVPSWASDKTRVWIMPATTNSKAAFTVQMAIPLDASGLNLPGDNLQMWYSVQPSVPLDADPGLMSFSWPRGNPAKYSFYTTSTNTVNIPDPSEWGEFAIGMQTGCAGVTLSQGNVGVKNTEFPNNRNQISLNVPDTFYALPKNETGQPIDMSDIKATFYFANWGTQRGDLTDKSWKLLTPNLSNVGSLQNPIDPVPALDPTVAANPAAVAANGLVQISKNWSLNQTEKCRFFVEGQINKYLAEVNNPGFCSGKPAPDVNPHGCMLVKLNSNKLEFLNDSVIRNMDFVKHSTSVRDAEIRLPLNSRGSRDVYLSVERSNMSPTVNETTVPKATTMETERRTTIKAAPLAIRSLRSKGERLSEITPILAQGKLPNLKYEELAAIMPTYVVHAFHDTGQNVFINGRRHKLLEQQTSFGYFAWHAGDVQGWTDSLQGAQKIRPDFYKVAVPVDRPVKVKITTEAIERPIIIKPDIPVIRIPERRIPEIINRDKVMPGRVPQIVR